MRCGERAARDTGDVRKSLLLVAVWLLAGAGALAAATVGVSTVGNQVTGDRPAPLSASEVREELRAAATSTTAAAATSTTLAPLAADTTTVPTTSVPASSGSTTTSTSPTASPGQSGASEVRTYTLVGGTATLRFEPAGVTVVAATPNPGFSVSIEAEETNGVKVEFEGDDVRSRVTGWWEGGPREEVREDDD